MEWIVVAVAVVLALPVAMYVGQDRLIFHPQPATDAARAQTANSFPGAADLFIEARDGTRLHAWHIKGSPLILYFGGNAEDVSWMLGRAARNAAGSGWLLVDYRGYGSSAGSPSEERLVSDAMEWYDYARQKLNAQSIVVFGRSLGSGVAVQLAAARPVQAVILATPFDSLTNVARHHYPYLPVSWMLKHRVRLVGPCALDRRAAALPRRRARRSRSGSPFETPFRRVAGTKRWVELGGAGHNSTDDVPAFWQAIREFLVQPH